MSRSDDTLYRQWVMLAKIPRYPQKTTVSELKAYLLDEGYMVDKRTVQRDLNKLTISFPLCSETEGRKNYWFWVKDAVIQDLPGMNPVTALAFEMAESYLRPLLPETTLALLEPYFNRAKNVLSDQSKSMLRTWPEKVSVIDRGPVLLKPVIKGDIQSVIYQALLEEKTISGTYQPRFSQQTKEYLIHPLGIVSRMGVIYLICTLWGYNDVVQLALHRFLHVESNDNPAKINADFSLHKYIEEEQELSYPLKGNSISLKVLFNPNTADHLAETPLTATQIITRKDDGRVLLETEILETLELRWWLQGFGANVEVLEPIEFRNKFKKMSGQLTAIYM